MPKMVARQGIFVLIFVIALIPSLETSAVSSIGVIGGGIGGTSAAYFLRQLFGDNVDITLYERSEVGGRLATIKFEDEEFESGGSIFHPANKHMLDFLQILGLEKRRSRGDDKLALYNGSEFVLRSCIWNIPMCTLARMLLRYGLDLYKIEIWVQNLIRKFSRIYELQKDGHAFTSVGNLLKAMDPILYNMTKFPLDKQLSEDGISERFISELAEAAMRTNYGQNAQIHSFVGSVSLAGIQSGLWSVEGGNKNLAKGLLEKSNAQLKSEAVKEIMFDREAESFTVIDGSSKQSNFDLLFLAFPIHEGNTKVKFTNFPTDISSNFVGSYHRTIATFVSGDLNETFFNYAPEKKFFNEILATNEQLFFNSISQQHSVNSQQQSEHGSKFFKVFSKQVLTQKQLDSLFRTRTRTEVVDWNAAYPRYFSFAKFSKKIEISPNLFYLNGIEWAASAAEMSAISAKNAALLAFNRNFDRCSSHCDKTSALQDDKKVEL